MNKLLLLATLFLVGCNGATKDSPALSVGPLLPAINTPTKVLIPLNAWDDLGKPLFDIEAYYDMFYKHQQGSFAISERLKTKADEFLYPLSQRDFINLYQDLLHSTTTEKGITKVDQRIMYEEYLYSNEHSFYVEVNRKGQGRVVSEPKKNGYIFDFITAYTANPQDSFYQINAFFLKSTFTEILQNGMIGMGL